MESEVQWFDSMKKMKPASRAIKVTMLITGEELAQLKRHTWMMVEAFGLDTRIDRYQGKRPIGFYPWDMDCLIMVADSALKNPKEYPSQDSPEYLALKRLHDRLEEEYHRAFKIRRFVRFQVVPKDREP